MSPSRHELLGVELLIAEIGPGAEWEQVDGSNDRHPGQTFDFAIGSGSDRWRAVEITAAADESEIRVRAQIQDVCTQIEQRISETDPHAAGWYVLEGIISEQTQPREFNVEHLALSRLPHSPRTALDLPDACVGRCATDCRGDEAERPDCVPPGRWTRTNARRTAPSSCAGRRCCSPDAPRCNTRPSPPRSAGPGDRLPHGRTSAAATIGNRTRSWRSDSADRRRR